ncbi:MAG TPA: hypothetical protein VH639_14140 [Bryobacteraceae bacterium]
MNNAPWKRLTSASHVEFIAEPVRVAMTLRQQGAFANPFGTPTGSTAHVAPALPALQAVILKLFGDRAGGWLALRSLAALALSLQLALLPWAAHYLGYTIRTGVLAFLIASVLKPALEERWESHLAGLVGLLITISASVWLNRDRAFA